MLLPVYIGLISDIYIYVYRTWYLLRINNLWWGVFYFPPCGKKRHTFKSWENSLSLHFLLSIYSEFIITGMYVHQFVLFLARQPQVGHGHLIIEVSRSHTTTHHTPLDKRSARRRDLYLTTHNTHNRQTSMFPVGFEPTISAGGRPQTYALDRAATGTGTYTNIIFFYKCRNWIVLQGIVNILKPIKMKVFLLRGLPISEKRMYLQVSGFLPLVLLIRVAWRWV
jgi:hypothetical protein